jgi:hypothetical protein
MEEKGFRSILKTPQQAYVWLQKYNHKLRKAEAKFRQQLTKRITAVLLSLKLFNICIDGTVEKLQNALKITTTKQCFSNNFVICRRPGNYNKITLK